MERERILEEVAKIEAYLASYRPEEGELAFNTSMGCFRAKPLRSVCIRRGIRAQGKEFRGASTKNNYIAALWEHCRSHGTSSPTTTETTRQDTPPLYAAPPNSSHSLIRPAQPTKHCVIRLMNVLFSDGFSHRLAALHAGAEDRSFWEDVAASYCSTSLELDGLISAHQRYRTLNPSAAEPHPPAKLRDVWNTLCVVYEAAFERVLMTDKSSGNFSEVYQGRLDVLYLHEWLRIRPELTSTVGIKLLEQEDTEQSSSPSDVSETQSNYEASEADLETNNTQTVVEVATAESVPETQMNDVKIIADTQTLNTEEGIPEAETSRDSTQSIVETQVDEEHADEVRECTETQTKKRRLITDILQRDAPDEMEIKRRRLNDSSEYVRSLFRTVETMRSAGCDEPVLSEMLQEAQRQASKLVRASKNELP